MKSAWLHACLIFGCLSIGGGPRSACGHGLPDAAIGFDVTVVVDARHIEITADMDLPTGFAVDLRNQLDQDHDYQVQSADEQQRLLWVIQAGDGPIRFTVDGTHVELAPLYNPQLRILTRASASLRGRGQLRASWFGYTPEGIRPGSRLEFTQTLWDSLPADVRLNLVGKDGLSLRGGKLVSKTFAPKQERAFHFAVERGIRAERKGDPDPPSTAKPPTRMIPANAVQLAEALAQHYAHLLPEGDATGATAIHRRLRMGIQRARFRRASEIDLLEAASTDLVRLLERAPEAIRIDLRESSTLGGPPRNVAVPGDAGGVLLRVANGAGPHRARLYDRSFDIGEFRDPLNAGEFAAGTTWILARLSEVPADPTILKIALTAHGVTRLLPLRITSPAAARLRLSVLADDSGEPAPAMVSLRWKTLNRDRRPATAIDLLPQFGGQGRQTSVRTPRLTGLRAKGFWVVPEPFEMELPPGEWEVVVRRGAEHTIIADRFTLAPGERAEKTYRPQRWINQPARGWYAGDDHVHSRIMSDADARNLLAYVAAEDIYLANIVKMGDINRTFFQQRGHGPPYRVTDGLRVLSPGQECPRTHEQLGHTLAMNTTSFIRDTSRYYLYDTVFDEVHRQGGLSGYAHVNRDLFHVHRDMSLNVPRGKVDFGEILQFGQLGTDLYYEFLNLGCKLTASAGSDLPWGGTIGEVRVYAHLGDKRFTADNWFAAFGRGRTFVTSGPMLDLRVEDALPGDTLELAEDRAVKVRATLEVDPALGAAQLELVSHGQVVKRVAGDGIGHLEIRFETEVPVRGGTWIALRGKAADGSVAHTTPVYVTRKGLRFWKMDEVETLVAKRRRQLDEIETIVAEARQAVNDGASPALIEIHELAAQGDRLLQRVRIARENYSDLMRRFVSEGKLRRR